MIGAVENALLERMRIASDPATGVLGYEYGTLETYPEDWQAYWDTPAAKRLNYPALFVTFGGASGMTSYTGGVKGTAMFGVIVAAKSLRNQRDARQGSGLAGEVGSYQLALDVIGLMEGHRLGLDIGALQTRSLQFVSLSQKQRELGLSMMAIQFETQMQFGDQYLEPTAEFLGNFDTFQVKWELPSSDGLAEFSQTIDLTTEEA